MRPQDYEIAMYAQSVWRLARSSDAMEMIAVACAIRNHVIPKPGFAATYPTFTEACEDFMNGWSKDLRALPSLADPAFVLPPNGLLCHISDIYFGRHVDITASESFPSGARWFARTVSLPDDHWFKISIVTPQAVHPLIGTFGSMQFYV